MGRPKSSTPSILDIKRDVRARDGGCTKCGITNAEHLARFGRQLDVHRVVPGSVYAVETAVAICRGCHGSQPKRKPGEPDHARPGFENLNVWVRSSLVRALDAYLESVRPRITKTALVETLLEWHLASKGYKVDSTD
jgi:hypothetical protein